MSIVTDTIKDSRYVKDSATVRKPDITKDVLSSYTPTADKRERINVFLQNFRLGWQTMHLPRPELNDLSLYQRHIVDMLSFNVYQENDGMPRMEDRLGGWMSTAIRPVIRNKAISIAAHRNARLLVPKISAYNTMNDEDVDAAKVMSFLVDYGRENGGYNLAALYRSIMSLYSPISWGYSGYGQEYRKIKDKKVEDKWTYKYEVDEGKSGFKHIPISTDQVFFPDFYVRDCQDQDFLILRRIRSYKTLQNKYKDNPDWQFVPRNGMVLTMDDANQSFYHVYDPHMRANQCEELIMWCKDTDSMEVMVNGVLISEPEEANPRMDHQYPFDNFYYLPINEKCIAGKSLTFALTPDANIVTEQYRMILDGGKMNLFPPTVFTGTDKVGGDVMVPGQNISLADKDVQVNALKVVDNQALNTMMNITEKVEASINESSQDPIQQGQQPSSPSTAYEISRIEQNAATVLGFSMKFQAEMHVIPYGKLLLSDILQYLTVGEAADIAGNPGLVYKSFYAKEPGRSDKKNKVVFDATLPDTMTAVDKNKMSYEILKAQGGLKSSTSLFRVNPTNFRKNKYRFAIDTDVMNPRSAELDRAYATETFDRAIAHPEVYDAKEIGKLFLDTDPKARMDVDKFMAKAQQIQPQQPTPTPNAPIQGGGLPQNFSK